jgi:hypothetical protein
VSENPRAFRSTHVLRNLGTERVRTLSDILGEPLARARAASPSDRDADSSHRQETRMVTIDTHDYQPDPRSREAICTSCKQPKRSEIHGAKAVEKISIKGTATPDKLG